jgi:hypothetical protein
VNRFLISRAVMGRKKHLTYKLEQLYDHQDPGFVLEAIAPLICWLEGKQGHDEYRFELREVSAGGNVDHDLVVSWDVSRLAKHDPRLLADLQRYRTGKTLSLEHEPELAACGLAMVAISCLLHRRVVGVSWYRPPDLLLDDTAGALRGVEVAGRTSRGYTGLNQVLDGAGGKLGKRIQLLARNDVVEAYISLWCREPRVSIWEQVKP